VGTEMAIQCTLLVRNDKMSRIILIFYAGIWMKDLQGMKSADKLELTSTEHYK
jgi:hypothetical protein